MQCDGRTFTETNGNIVSEKADRAVNRGPSTEQININRKSFSERSSARQQRHQTLSSLLMSPGRNGPGRCPWTLTSELAWLQMGRGQMSPGLLFQPHCRPSWDRFRGVFSRAEPSALMVLSSPASANGWKHGGESCPLWAEPPLSTPGSAAQLLVRVLRFWPSPLDWFRGHAGQEDGKEHLGRPAEGQITWGEISVRPG